MSTFDETPPADQDAVDVSKSDMVRDAIVFQLKLVVDGIRDFVLIPGGKSGSEFYEVVAFGRRTEKLINLFGAADRLGREEPEAERDLDSFVDDVESYVRREAQGERFDAVRERIERALGMRGAGTTRTGEEPQSGDDAISHLSPSPSLAIRWRGDRRAPVGRSYRARSARHRR